MNAMRGRYPGGPSRRDGADGESSGPERVHLASVEEMETRSSRASRKIRAKRRRKRLVLGFILSAAGAALAGGYVGLSTHRTSAELAQELDQKHRPARDDLEQQMNRLIDEMWKSEALEKRPNLR